MEDNHPLVETKSKFIFVGCGSSTGTPKLSCLRSDPVDCKICVEALQPGNLNRRRNPSILIQWKGKNILIDCGKTFRESILSTIVEHNVRKLDAVIITHGHADALLGMDDLREFTELNSDQPIPIYFRTQDLKTIQNVFPYLYDTAKATGSGFVSQLKFISFDESKPFYVLGLKITPLVVEHGPNNTALGFKFGRVVYLSDVSKILEKAKELIFQTENGSEKNGNRITYN